MAGASRQTTKQVVLFTCAIWGASYLVFLLPTLIANGWVPPHALALFALSTAPGLLLSPPIYLLLRATVQWHSARRWTVLTLAIILIAWVHSYVDVAIADFFVRHVTPDKPLTFPPTVLGSLLVYIWLYGLYAAIIDLMRASAAMQEREMMLAQARTATHRAQLAALRLQLNPHFLFNTLNAISSLVVNRRNGEAEVMIERLCDFLRATLNEAPEGFVTLDEELDSIGAYLDIEKARFGDRLIVRINCPTRLGGAIVPSFILQPLVENAIRYAVAPSCSVVTVSIEALELEGGQLLLRVEDDGGDAAPDDVPQTGSGIGLTNIVSRLQVLYGASAKLTTLLGERGFSCSLVLPLRMESGAEMAA